MKEEMTSLLSKIELSPDMSLSRKMALMTKYDRLNKLSNQLAQTALEANALAQKMIDGEMVNVYEINYNDTAKILNFTPIDHTIIEATIDSRHFKGLTNIKIVVGIIINFIDAL